MRRALAGLAAIALIGWPALAFGHGPSQPPHQQYRIGDFKLESGEAIGDFSISYVTHGTLNAQKSNAILMVTAISGNHHRLDFLIGPGKALDPTRYFIVATDAIGNGLTTSPSNSTSQPRMQFPRFLIRDMVASQHRLLTEHLGVKHVVAVIGPSMGGMQALQWGVSHPKDLSPGVRRRPRSVALHPRRPLRHHQPEHDHGPRLRRRPVPRRRRLPQRRDHPISRPIHPAPRPHPLTKRS